MNEFARVEIFLKTVRETLGAAPNNIVPGELVRFKTDPSKSSKSGYCRIYPDLRGGYFGDFRTAEKGSWSFRTDMTASERARLNQQVKNTAQRDEQERDLRWENNRHRNILIWSQASCLNGSDPASRYLDGRGISKRIYMSAGLKFHPALPYWCDRKLLGTFPALVGCFQEPGGRCVSIHRTFLTSHGQKAEVPAPKKLSASSGALGGGCIRLAREIDGVIGVSEGIENGLCAMEASGVPVVAATSASCLAAYQWPPSVTKIIIFADRDENGVGQRAAYELAARARCSGLWASVLLPSMVGIDWADVWSSRGNRSLGGVNEL